MVVGKKFVLVKHFKGEPKEGDVALVEFEVPRVKEGEIMLEAEVISVDPYQRVFTTKMPLGITIPSAQIGRIVESKNPRYPVGKKMIVGIGWVTHSVFNPDTIPVKMTLNIKPDFLPDFGDLPDSLGVGMLGHIGASAQIGFLDICKPKTGETVVVSDAAGAVGSHVGQIGKILGLKVIGIAGTSEKCKWLVDELGFDHAINYKNEDVLTELSKAAPEGVDCYFDNVGGEIASIVIHQMNYYGRIAACGSISAYNCNYDMRAKELPVATVIQPVMVLKQLKMEGFLVTDPRYATRINEAVQQNLAWIREGKLCYRETITYGFENTYRAFTGMLKGENIGKAIVKL